MIRSKTLIKADRAIKKAFIAAKGTAIERGGCRGVDVEKPSLKKDDLGSGSLDVNEKDDFGSGSSDVEGLERKRLLGLERKRLLGQWLWRQSSFNKEAQQESGHGET